MKVLILADDLTGANDTGAMLAGRGFSAVAFPQPSLPEALARGREVVSVNADSRALSPREAYARLHALASSALPAQGNPLLSKRIDSTLRGNVGAEIDAVLDALPGGTRAAVVAASPGAGRVCVGGYVLVHGVPLLSTGMAKDPRTPVTESEVGKVISQQSARPQRLLPLCDVLQGPKHLAARIRETDAPILVFDAAQQEHLRCIANALEDSGAPYVCVDPGAFTLEAALRRFGPVKRAQGRRLVVVGSRAQESRAQLDFLRARPDVAHYNVDVDALLDSPKAELNRALAFFAREDHPCCCVSTVYAPLRRQKVAQIAPALSEMAYALLAPLGARLCYLSGGDVAKCFLERAQAAGVELIEEVLPLAVYGRLLGGPCHGLGLLTKGGSIGGPDAIAVLLDYAKEKEGDQPK